MSFCYQCGAQLGGGHRFCPSCGAAVAGQTSTPVATPMQAQPVYTRPSYEQPQVSGGVKAKGFVGMGLGIGGLVFSVVSLFMCLLFLDRETELAFAFACAYNVFALPLAIVGRILSTGSRRAGNLSGVCGAGAVLSLVSLILSGIALFVGFVAMAGA